VRRRSSGLARLVVVSGLTALVATGCFRVHVRIDVEDDGSGTVEGLTALNTDYFTADQDGVVVEGPEGVVTSPFPSRDEVCEEFRADQDIPPGVDVEPYDEGAFCGFTYHSEFADGEIHQVLQGTEDLVLERDGDGWRFVATVEDSSDDDLFPVEALAEIELLLRLKLPGRQVEHNADRIESDGTLVWDIDLADPPDVLFARTEPGQPITGSTAGTSWLVWGGLGLVAVAAAVSLLLLRRPTAPSQDGQSSPTPTGRDGSAPHSDQEPT